MSESFETTARTVLGLLRICETMPTRTGIKRCADILETALLRQTESPHNPATDSDLRQRLRWLSHQYRLLKLRHDRALRALSVSSAFTHYVKEGEK